MYIFVIYLQGDSGCLLVLGGRTVIGILSMSKFDCNENFGPALYTRVTSFRTFIDNAMRGVKTDNMRRAFYQLSKAKYFWFSTETHLIEDIKPVTRRS